MLLDGVDHGRVVASIGTGRHLPEHDCWAYLGEGIMVGTAFGRQTVAPELRRRALRRQPLHGAAGDTAAVADRIVKAAARFKTPPRALVHSVYEAGRDGWWFHRWLCKLGVDNIVALVTRRPLRGQRIPCRPSAWRNGRRTSTPRPRKGCRLRHLSLTTLACRTAVVGHKPSAANVRFFRVGCRHPETRWTTCPHERCLAFPRSP